MDQIIWVFYRRQRTLHTFYFAMLVLHRLHDPFNRRNVGRELLPTELLAQANAQLGDVLPYK